MRRRTATAAVAVIVTATALAPTAESAPVPLVPVGAGWFAEDVEYLGTIPFDAGSAGARFVDDTLYVTQDRGVTIYDLTDPEAPELQGFWPSPQAAYISEEDVDTNGEILLVGMYEEAGGAGPLDAVNVIDVSDPTLPVRIGQVQGADEHTISCVLDCTWAWGSAGVVVDLTDPTAPTIAGNWWSSPGGVRDQLAAAGHEIEQSSAHDVTEIAPGLVAVSTNPVAYVEVDPTDATKTVLRNVAPLPDDRYIHGNLWPNEGVDGFGELRRSDDLFLVGGETGLPVPGCGPDDGAFMVFDASEVKAEARDRRTAMKFGLQPPPRQATFDLLDEWRVEGSGLYTDGNSPYNQFCAHWFTTQPGWDDGGIVAVGWYEHGVRFLDVDPARRDVPGRDVIEEVAWFVPLGGSTSAAYWVSDDVVYTTDYQRGIDVLRFAPDGDDEVDMAGDVPLVAARTVDPNQYFPWFGLEATLASAGITGQDADDGWNFCQIPVTAEVVARASRVGNAGGITDPAGADTLVPVANRPDVHVVEPTG